MDPLHQLTTSKLKQDRPEYSFQEYNFHWKFFILPGDWEDQTVTPNETQVAGTWLAGGPCGDLAGRNLPLGHMRLVLISGHHSHLRRWATCAHDPPFLTQLLHHCPSIRASRICLSCPPPSCILPSSWFSDVCTIRITWER